MHPRLNPAAPRSGILMGEICEVVESVLFGLC